MTTYNDIRAALETEIANISGVPSAANRSWENIQFEPTLGTTWIRMSMVPIQTRPAVMGPSPSYLHTGFFVVDIFTPEGLGPGSAETLADAILARYNVDTSLTSGSIQVRFRYAEKRQGVIDSPWYQMPVVIEWYCYET